MNKSHTIRLAQTYCPSCHLSTRADIDRCLHCRRPIHDARELRHSEETRQWAAGRRAETPQPVDTQHC